MYINKETDLKKIEEEVIAKDFSEVDQNDIDNFMKKVEVGL